MLRVGLQTRCPSAPELGALDRHEHARWKLDVRERMPQTRPQPGLRIDCADRRTHARLECRLALRMPARPQSGRPRERNAFSETVLPQASLVITSARLAPGSG